MRFLQTHLVAIANGLPITSQSITARPLQRCLHQTSVAFRPRQRTFFTTNYRLARDNSQKNDSTNDGPVAGSASAKEKDVSKAEHTRHNHPNQSGGGGGKDRDGNNSGNNNNNNNSNKKKGNKNPPSKPKPKLRDPLRRVASLAQRGTNRKPQPSTQDGAAMPGKDYAQTICAICVAESFDMAEVLRALHDKHYAIDPDNMGFDEDEVVHARISADARPGEGDFYIFASGTVVTWSLPADKGVYVARHVLHSAKERAHDADIHTDKLTEKLEFETDPSTAQHSMRGDTVVLGTKIDPSISSTEPTADTGRAKIAFSSGLARSTKVAVLETLLEEFLAATERYPDQLAKRTGDRWWARGAASVVTMPTVSQRTGEILQLRAQLNFFSELTDDLPDKFWDQRSELNLDTIYDKVGKALDVPSRIRVMNQRMDYADKMLDTFRGQLQAKKDSWLEEIIVILISIEVIFQLINWWREYRDRVKAEGGEVSFGGLGLWVLGMD